MNQILQILRNKLFSNYAIYLGSNLIGSAIPFLFLPVLTRYLSPAEYGIVATFQIFLFIFSIFIGVNIHGALSRNYFDFDDKQLKVFNFNLIIISLCGFLITLTVAEIFIYLGIVPPDLPSRWLSVIAITALFEVWSTLVLSLWRVQEKPFKFGKFQISKIIINVSLSILLVVVLNLNWQGRLMSVIITDITFGSIALLILCRNNFIEPSLNLRYIKDALSFGVPLIPHSLSGWVTTYIDRFFIASMVGMADVGIYSVAYQIGSIIGVIATSFNQAWTPFLFKKLTHGKLSDKLSIVQFTYFYFIGLLLLVVILSLSTPIAINLFLGREFQDTYRYIPWVALGYAFDGMYYMVVNYILFVKKNGLLAATSCTAALLNIILNYFLVGKNGALGAAQATSLTSLFTFLSIWYISSKVYIMPWKLVRNTQ